MTNVYDWGTHVDTFDLRAPSLSEMPESIRRNALKIAETLFPGFRVLVEKCPLYGNVMLPPTEVPAPGRMKVTRCDKTHAKISQMLIHLWDEHDVDRLWLASWLDRLGVDLEQQVSAQEAIAKVLLKAD